MSNLLLQFAPRDEYDFLQRELRIRSLLLWCGVGGCVCGCVVCVSSMCVKCGWLDLCDSVSV